jgi:very-short-patch-repair endonuclease
VVGRERIFSPPACGRGRGRACLDKGYKRPTARSRELRLNATDAERKLWTQLSARKVADVRFNRHFPIGPFICDFVSRSAKLIIEVDGGQHAVDVAKDEARTAYLEAQGYLVIRFWNNDVLERIDGVIAEIERALSDMPSPSPSRKREGDS